MLRRGEAISCSTVGAKLQVPEDPDDCRAVAFP
jgi:hypothetical protein